MCIPVAAARSMLKKTSNKKVSTGIGSFLAPGPWLVLAMDMPTWVFRLLLVTALPTIFLQVWDWDINISSISNTCISKYWRLSELPHTGEHYLSECMGTLYSLA